MNGNDILKAMNGIDESCISEQPQIRQSKRFLRRPAAAAAAVCAALAMTVTAGAVIHSFYHEETVERYGLTDIPMTEETLPEHAGSMENGHIRVTVDKIVNDGTMGYIIFTADCLDELGYGLKCGSSKVVREPGHPEMPFFVLTTEKVTEKTYESEKNYLRSYGYGPSEDVSCMRIEGYFDANAVKDADVLYLSILDMQSGIKNSEVISGLTGLRVENFRKNLPTRELRNSEGRVLTISPVSMSFADLRDGLWCFEMQGGEPGTPNETESHRNDHLIVTYRDGTVYDAEDSWFASGLDGSNCFHKFDKQIDWENVEKIEIFGTVFS